MSTDSREQFLSSLARECQGRVADHLKATEWNQKVAEVEKGDRGTADQLLKLGAQRPWGEGCNGVSLRRMLPILAPPELDRILDSWAKKGVDHALLSRAFDYFGGIDCPGDDLVNDWRQLTPAQRDAVKPYVSPRDVFNQIFMFYDPKWLLVDQLFDLPIEDNFAIQPCVD